MSLLPGPGLIGWRGLGPLPAEGILGLPGRERLYTLMNPTTTSSVKGLPGPPTLKLSRPTIYSVLRETEGPVNATPR